MDYSFFSGLIQNVALLLVFSYLYATRWIDSVHSNRLLRNVFLGIIVGGIGILLMSTPWMYRPGYYFDLRTILLAIAGLYFGAIPTMTAILIMVAYRLYLGGEMVTAGLFLIAVSGLLVMAWRYLQNKQRSRYSLLSLYFLGVVVHLVMLILPILSPREEPMDHIKVIALPIITIYPIIAVLLGELMNRQLENWENQKAKERLYESEQRFTEMLWGINMIFVQTDLDKKIIFCNKYLLSITGYSSEEVIGKNFIDIFVPIDEKEKIEEEFHELFRNNGSIQYFESKILTQDHRVVYISWHNSVITDDEGKVKGIASLGENITEKKITFDKLKEAKENAEASNLLKSVFLQNISHEVRTPLNAIMGSIGLLREFPDDEAMRGKFYEILEISGERLLSTVNDLIDISQVETQQLKVNLSNVSLSTLLAKQIDVATPLAEKKKNKIICSSEYLYNDIILHTDKNMLNGIFINLLNNANKFTTNGTIEIGSYDENGDIVFYVKDDGIGIPKNRLGVIFDRFVQADTSLSRPHEGSGLGLSIAQAYARLLGGNIWVQSEVEKGSTFFFRIPKKEGAPAIPVMERDDKALPALPSWKILIAEDDDLNYLILKKIIERMGIANIVRAANGAEAVEKVLNDDEISLVLMDIKMPEMSGEEATQKIRTFHPSIPIIAQTAFAMPGDRERFIAMGCDDYLPKPIEKARLIDLLHKYLPAGSQDAPVR